MYLPRERALTVLYLIANILLVLCTKTINSGFNAVPVYEFVEYLLLCMQPSWAYHRSVLQRFLYHVASRH